MNMPAAPQPAAPVTAVGRNAQTLKQMTSSGLRIAEKVYLPGRVLPPHFHDFSNVTFVLAGAMAESTATAREIARAGSWVTKPAGVKHANRVGRHGARVLEIVFSGAGPAARLDYAWRRGGPEAITFLRIYHELRKGQEGAEEVISGLVHGLLRGGERDRGTGPEWIGAVHELLHDADGPIPSLRTLAQAFHVHPTYLARVFRRRYGRSIGDYTRRLRIERAARRLAHRRPVSLAGIALDTGFADQSHLTRMFRSLTGMTPGAFRALIRDPPGPR